MVFTSVVFPFLASNLLSVVPLLLGLLLLNQKGLKGGLWRLGGSGGGSGSTDTNRSINSPAKGTRKVNVSLKYLQRASGVIV